LAAVVCLLLLAAGTPSQARVAAVELTVVADESCAPRLRDVLQEQLADLAAVVVWSCRQRLDDDEPFRIAEATTGGVRLWIDVSGGAEARLTVRDDRSDRFIVRRIPLARGLDEVGREQIGQILRWSVLAVTSGTTETSSRSEARATVSSWPDRSHRSGTPGGLPAPRGATPSRDAPRSPAPIATTAPVPRAGPRRGGFVEIGPTATARAFSRGVPIAEEIGIALAFGGSSAWALWAQGDYRLPVTDRAAPVGVEIRAVALRGGLLGSTDRRSRLSFRAGGGIGFERVSFSPRPADGSVDLAPPGSFLVGTGRALVGAQWRATARVVLGFTVFCDVQATDVHFDLRQSDGTVRRVLVPFALQPGVMVTVLGRIGS
jgi:hypothetical protein